MEYMTYQKIKAGGFGILFTVVCTVAGLGQLKLDSLTLVTAKFKTINTTEVQQARSQISNVQWQYTLPPLEAASASTVIDFAKNRPTVVVLIHGVTGYPSTDNRIGTLKGARNYWGYDFVYDLLGATSDRPTSFANDDIPAGTIGKPEWETKFISSNTPSHHFVTIYGKPNLTAATPFYTPFSIMMTYRDGSVSFKKQVSATAAQIVSLYNSMFGTWPDNKKPQLILLCHSFGGVIARAICSKPNNIPSNDNNVNTENFNATDKENMDFIRNKTLHITTLSTPHEGSQITFNAALGTVLQHIPFLGIGTQIDKSDPDTDILQQLKTGFMENVNQTVLKPELCKRSDGSLIPIHAAGGRVPAGPEFFENPNENDNDLATVDGGIGRTNVDDLLAGETNRNKFECYNLVRVDYAMHLFFGGLNGKPWGATPADNTALDIVKISDVQPVLGCLTNPIYNAASFAVKPRLYYLRNNWTNIPANIAGVQVGCSFRFTEGSSSTSDGEIDNDGFVPINSSLGVKLGSATKNYFDHSRSWTISGNNVPAGSWYRFYRSDADLHNHGTIKFSGIIGKWLRENIIGNTPTALLFGTMDRFKAAGPKVATTGTVSTW